MTPEELIEAFDAVAEAPEGITRLRELVLQLAVRGRLVPQDPGDDPAELLLARGRDALLEATRDRRRGNWKPSSPVEPSEVPFELPSGWAWARVNDTGRYVNGLAFKPSDWKPEGTRIIRIQNLTDAAKPFNHAEGEFDEDVMVQDGDLLVSWSATLDTFLWDRGVGVLNQHIFRVIPCDEVVTRRFLYWLLRQAIRDMAASEHAHGLVMKHINRGPFLAHVVAVPPTAEQQRIVARVDELMGLLDRLEAARSAREETRTAARDAALAALLDADTQEEVEAAWDRVAGRMDDLFTDPADVEPLRQTVLQLAVRGRLVPQDPEDEPASVLFEQIRTDKAAFIEEHGLRRVRKMKKIEAGEVPHPIPDNWVWCRLGTIANAQPGFAFNAAQFNDIGEGEPLIRIRDVLGGATSTFYSGEFRDEYIVSTGDYLIGMDGNFNIGRWKSGRALLNQRVARLRWYSSSVESGYVVRPLQQRLDQLYGVKTYTTVQHLSGKQIEDALIPLPPRAEQERIVARVDELMGLLDRLEAHLRGKTDLQDEFATAAVHHLEAS